tara:strand:+ start:14361 stop:15758 length:1398 start_codon:yes stop_codon:yes gene_type:complete
LKNILKGIIIIFILTVLGYFIYTQHQKVAVLKNVVHVDAESVIKVGIHEIKKTLVFDVLSSPSYYWQNSNLTDTKKEKDSLDEQKKGIDLLPYALVFYTMKNVKNTVFTTFKIDDTKDFEAFSLRYLTDKNISITKDVYTYAIDEKSKMILAWNSERLAVAFSPKLSFKACKQVFDDVLLRNNVIHDSDNSKINKLSSRDDHITYLSGNSEVALNFVDGKAVLEGNIFTASPDSFNTEITYTPLQNASLELYIDANFEHNDFKKVVADLLEGASFFENNNIEISSFLDKVNGVISLAVKGTTTQKDTIITYEYDDNFEKVETLSIQEKNVPAIVMNIGSEKDITAYLTKQGAIKNGILTAIPYYTFYTKADALSVTFTTANQIIAAQKKKGSYFFSLETNFSHLQQDLNIPKADKVASLLETLRINAQQGEENEIVIEGKLEAVNRDINIISQLFFGLQPKDSLP